jgi:hypothetical protein
MSYLDTKQALLQQLLTVANSSQIAFENKTFDPTGSEFWYAAYFKPATTESTGKTLASSDQQYGFFQVSVFTERNLPAYDNLSLQKIDLILSAFKNTTTIAYNGQKVDILETTINDGRVSESWYQRDMTIYYLTFSER